MAEFKENAGLTDDEVRVELSSERVVPDTDRFADQMALALGDTEAVAADDRSIKEARPADNAPKAKWIDYCVLLGAQRGFLEFETRHYVSGTGKDAPPNPAPVYVSPAFTVDEMKDFATRLGG